MYIFFTSMTCIPTMFIDHSYHIYNSNEGEGTGGVIKNGKVPCRCKTPEARHPGDGKPQESGFSQGRLGTQRCKSKSKSEEREQVSYSTCKTGWIYEYMLQSLIHIAYILLVNIFFFYYKKMMITALMMKLEINHAANFKG